MFCKYCGNEIDGDSVFCRICGKSQGEVKAEATKLAEKKLEAPKLESKVFTFGGMSYNKKNIDEINKWLSSQKMIIKSVNINTFMNNNLPLKWETVVNRLEVNYTIQESGKLYQMGFFTSKKWIGSSYKKVVAAFEEWKKDSKGYKEDLELQKQNQVKWYEFYGFEV